MKQLDVDVSPPAFVWNLYLTLAVVTFDSAYRTENAPCARGGTMSPCP